MDTTTKHPVIEVLDRLDARNRDLRSRTARPGTADAEKVERYVTGLAYDGHALGSVRDLIAQQHGMSAAKAREVIRVAEEQGHVTLQGNASAVRVLDAERHARNEATKTAAADRRAAVIARLNGLLEGENGLMAVEVTYNGALAIATETLERIAACCEVAAD